MIEVNPSCLDPRPREKINLNFFFTLLFGASKGFMKVLKVFIKLFVAPKKCENKVFKLILILIQLFEMHGVRRVNI